MKRVLIISTAIIAVSSTVFSGCASDGIALNTVSNNRVDRFFHQGHIISQKKCVIDDREMATLTGAGIGGAGGAVVNDDIKSGAVGTVVGGLIGAVVGKEVIAYQTIILSKNKKYKGYLKDKLPLNTTVEFTVKDGKLKNVNVIKLAHFNHHKVKKIVVKPAIKTETLESPIDKRYYKNGLWYYHLRDYNVTLHSAKKYYYLYDLVDVTFDKNHNIVKIERLKRGVIKLRKAKQQTLSHTVAERPVPVTKSVEVEKPKTETVKKPVVKTETKKPAVEKKAVDSVW